MSNENNLLHKKERVLGILGSTQKAYSIHLFEEGTQVIVDSLDGKAIVVAGNQQSNLVVSFFSELEGTELSFTAVQNQLPIILIDNEGTAWDVFGYGVSGPRAGQRLTPTNAFMGYWFSFAAFYPEIELYQE